MSCLNLKGMFPTAKALKLLSARIFKLRHLNASKVIKKKKSTHTRKTSKRGGASAPPGLLPNLAISKRKKFRFKLAKKLDFYRKPAPVYVDQLFVEPLAVVKEPPRLLRDSKTSLDKMKKAEESLYGRETTSEVASSSAGYEDVQVDGGAGEADDMWEAVVASPDMHGIDERAEEFISWFRAEMKRQNTLENNL